MSNTNVSAFTDILSESGISGSDITVRADKEFASDDDSRLLEDNRLRYIIPLKRGSRNLERNIFVPGKHYIG